MPGTPPCPICHRSVLPRAENRAFPFCTPRCKLVDLGKWLDEQYRVPVDDSTDPEEGSLSTNGNRLSGNA